MQNNSIGNEGVPKITEEYLADPKFCACQYFEVGFAVKCERSQQVSMQGGLYIGIGDVMVRNIEFY